MCLARVYLQKNDAKELLLEDVASIEMADGKLTLATLFRETKEVEAVVRKVDFANSSVLLEMVASGG